MPHKRGTDKVVDVDKDAGDGKGEDGEDESWMTHPIAVVIYISFFIK